MSKISVIVPIYNVEKYLVKCIDSIINQTFTNLEIILVDDGSPDDCPSICNEYALRDSRVKVIHKKNGGLSDARNVAIDIATGDYLMFVDSDDYINLTMVETLVQKIQLDKADMCVCNYTKVYELSENNEVSVTIVTDTVIKDKKTMLQNISKYTTAWGKIYAKEIFSDIRYPINKIHEDAFISHIIVNKCRSISETSKYLYNYLQRESSIVGEKFSINRLDSVEASFLRTNFYIANNMSESALGALAYSANSLYLGYTKLDLNNKDVVNRLEQLKKEYKTLHKKLIFKKGKIKSKILAFSFLINPRLYGLIINFKNK